MAETFAHGWSGSQGHDLAMVYTHLRLCGWGMVEVARVANTENVLDICEHVPYLSLSAALNQTIKQIMNRICKQIDRFY
jgi:hypothetical protein